MSRHAGDSLSIAVEQFAIARKFDSEKQESLEQATALRKDCTAKRAEAKALQAEVDGLDRKARAARSAGNSAEAAALDARATELQRQAIAATRHAEQSWIRAGVFDEDARKAGDAASAAKGKATRLSEAAKRMTEAQSATELMNEHTDEVVCAQERAAAANKALRTKEKVRPGVCVYCVMIS